MAYSAIAVANAFIEKAKEKGINDLSVMKLLKLVYYAHAWSLAVLDRPLIDEDVFAWPYGPVIKSVYHEFKGYGSNNITKRGTAIICEDNEDYFPSYKYVFPKMPTNDDLSITIIDAVLEAYGDLSAISLSSATHKQGSAWDEVTKGKSPQEINDIAIPNTLIKKTMKRELQISEEI